MNMEILEYHSSAESGHWLSQLRLCDWSAGSWLCELIDRNWFFEKLGSTSKLLLLTEGEKLAAFCTLSERDDIPDTELTPWIGFVYTFPGFRGRRCFGRLLAEAENIASRQGSDAVYISTDHIGLYEKYGFEQIGTMTDRRGGESNVYIKRIIR